jgi:hypothetical protein
MNPWLARALVALLAFGGLGAVGLSILDGWRPAGGNGVPWIEFLIRDDPQARVNDYLQAVAGGDRDRALALWNVPDRGAADALVALSVRRIETTDILLAAGPRAYRITDVQWWSTCCEPHPVTQQAWASVARITVSLDASADGYIFDVRATTPGRSPLDEVTRHWSISDAYRAGDEPLLLRWLAFGNGSLALGAVSPAGTTDCGRSQEMPPAPYDAVARDCVWSAYSSGERARWTVSRRTVEGDPIRATITAQTGFIVVTKDMTADRFSAPSDRRLWAWQCRAMTKRVWATDPLRYFFELAECSGDGRNASFP